MPDGPARIIDAIDHDLRARATPERAEHERAYLKSSLSHYGTRVPDIRAIVRVHLPSRPAPTHDLLIAVVEGLWAEPVHERRSAAAIALERHARLLGPSDVVVVERLVRESKTWALVDVLAPAVMGPMVVTYPELGSVLDRWAADDNFWIRRAALLTLLKPLREGGGDWDRFARYADAMVDEREFFIRKAIGWVLREVARTRPELVHTWLLPRAARASGVTLREALKRLPAPMAEEILAARARP